MADKTRRAAAPMLTLFGAVMPETVNEERRTVNVKWYTGARVDRFSFSKGHYMLELSMDPKHVDMSRLSGGTAPLLNAHNSWSLGNVIGVIEEAFVKDGVGFATVRFSKREDAEVIYQDVKDGIIRNISVGAGVSKLELVEEVEGRPSVYRATKWQPMELSFVPIGADPNAQSFSVENGEGDPLEELIKGGNENMEQEAMAVQSQTEPVAAPAAEAALTAEQMEQLTRTERERAAGIVSLCERHGMTAEFRDRCIESGAQLDAVRAEILDKLAAAAPSTVSVSVGAEDGDKRREAFTSALLNRAAPGKYALADNAKDYRGRSLMEMARQYLEDSGENVRGMSRRDIAKLAVCGRSEALGAYISSSDLPLILGNTIGRRLRDEYTEMAPTWQQFCSRATAPNFKEMTVVGLTDSTEFKDIPEHGEYERGSVGDNSESYKVNKSGVIIAFTWEMMIDDDLSALDRVPRRIAASAREKEAKTVYNILLNNPNMGDGKALFHADHGNLATTAAVPNESSLTAAVEAFYAQTSASGRAINVKPRFLVHGGKNLVTVKKMLSFDMLANTSGNINVFKGEFVPVVDTHITDKRWFLISDPAMIDTIEYAYLDGEEGLFTEMRNGFEVDGLEIKARMVFGAKAIDWRGMYKNAGE